MYIYRFANSPPWPESQFKSIFSSSVWNLEDGIFSKVQRGMLRSASWGGQEWNTWEQMFRDCNKERGMVAWWFYVWSQQYKIVAKIDKLHLVLRHYSILVELASVDLMIAIGQEVTASICAMGDLDWILGNISSPKRWSDIGTGFPVKWWNHCP